MARQRLGQHFLADAGWREEIARTIRVSPGSIAPIARGGDTGFCWVEIGPGHGEMTEHLAGTGAPVYAIELDPKLAAALRRLEKRFPNLRVVNRDVLDTDLSGFANGRKVRVYGNLPYYITSPILHHLFANAEIIEEIDVVMQHEVALRLVAEPGHRDYGYLSVVTQYYSRPELVLEIPKTAFAPPPDVNSALVTLRFPGMRDNLKGLEDMAFLQFVKACFAQKRKTLANNFRAQFETEAVRSALTTLGLRADARAEQLSVSELAALFQALTKNPKQA